MKRLAAILTAIASLAPVAPAQAHGTNSTAYCLRGRMADGTFTRAGSMAHNGLRLGQRVTVRPRVFGRRHWTVRDRIGHGTVADFWTPSCAQAVRFGRRHIRITVGWR